MRFQLDKKVFKNAFETNFWVNFQTAHLAGVTYTIPFVFYVHNVTMSVIEAKHKRRANVYNLILYITLLKCFMLNKKLSKRNK